MEEDLLFFKMEDKLRFPKMEDDLNSFQKFKTFFFLENGRWQYFSTHFQKNLVGIDIILLQPQILLGTRCLDAATFSTSGCGNHPRGIHCKCLSPLTHIEAA
jgi:hypothetical protein